MDENLDMILELFSHMISIQFGASVEVVELYARRTAAICHDMIRYTDYIVHPCHTGAPLSTPANSINPWDTIGTYKCVPRKNEIAKKVKLCIRVRKRRVSVR